MPRTYTLQIDFAALPKEKRDSFEHEVERFLLSHFREGKPIFTDVVL
jgi:hypothetical protein